MFTLDNSYFIRDIFVPAQDEIKLFWKLINSCSPIQPLIINGNNSQLISILGCGATSVVFKAKLNGEEVAIKCGKSAAMENEAKIVYLLRDYDITVGLKEIVRGEDGLVRHIIYNVGRPALGGGWTPPADVTEITLKHMRQIFFKLVDLHTKVGLVHRDLRLANIVTDSDNACLIDFGYAWKIVDTPIPFAGSTSTASQRILGLLSGGIKSLVHAPEDDLESFLKMFIIWQEKFKLPKLDRDIASLSKSWLEAWAIHPHVEAFTEMKSYADKANYIGYALFFPLLPDALKRSVISNTLADRDDVCDGRVASFEFGRMDRKTRRIGNPIEPAGGENHSTGGTPSKNLNAR